ncbi:hypothetical protein [Mesoplasma photuris]|uniref:hypothetical protein n=1 Tax=Mesoplasma photuris TaxID=217731 RepID=UPI0004E27EBE|nr:hypothetical protein [Mesoplasma photuris]
MKQEKNKFKDKFKKFFRTLLFWKPIDSSIESDYFEDILNKLFLVNKSEKENILKIIEKRDIESLLFYTDSRNINHILDNGIELLKNLKLDYNENYHVWTFSQEEDSINLEFDVSSRGNFWKWSNDLDFNASKFCVLALDPQKIKEISEKDWLFDISLNKVSILEDIPPEAIKWIIVRDRNGYKNAKEAIKRNKLKAQLYFGRNGVVKEEQGVN